MNCYLCSSPLTPFLKKQEYMIFRCPSCGLAMTEFKENYEDFLHIQYDKGYFSGNPARSAYHNYREDRILISKNMEKFLSKILRYKSSGRLLDVGCAMGYFVEMALHKGFDAFGFDPSDYAITEAKKKMNGRVTLGSIQTVMYAYSSFDVISMFDVFEHLADPKSDLKKLRSLLTKNGIVVIATGDANSLMARILLRRWTFYNPPQHLFFYTRPTLSRLLQEEGFEPLHWFRVGKWISMRYMLHLARTVGESDIARIFYDALCDTKIGEIPLYLPLHDNMVVIARKSI